MGTRVSYPIEVKMKVVEMQLAGIPVKEVLEQLNIRNPTQLKVWMKWYHKGFQQLHQPVGKQYSFGKGPDYETEEMRLQAEIYFLKQQIDILKKYKELERKWLDKYL